MIIKVWLVIISLLNIFMFNDVYIIIYYLISLELYFMNNNLMCLKYIYVVKNNFVVYYEYFY